MSNPSFPPHALNGYPVIAAVRVKGSGRVWCVVTHREDGGRAKEGDYVMAFWYPQCDDTWSSGEYGLQRREAISMAAEYSER